VSAAEPPSPSPSPGDILLGKYRVEHVLGRGGMGIVVAARHLSLDDRVAIKFLLPDRLGDDEAVQRFLREARAAVRIRSQHIARVTDVGTMESGAPYMVMEYLEGRNLHDVVAQDGPLSVSLAVDLVLQASEALAEAHAQGIVHRDVKPSNLFLSRHADGSPCMKVLDFGISKMPGSHDHALTRTGAVFGSPLYMSPEQLRSARDVDPRADVYSLGVVLYELVTGRVPFNADDLPQLVYKITTEAPVSPRALRAEIPAPLERAILTAMARDRGARFPTIADLAVAIAPLGSNRAQGSAERILGIVRMPGAGTETYGVSGHGGAAGGRAPVPIRLPGEADTLPLLEPASELQSSIPPFGTTRAKSVRPHKGRGAAAPAAFALGVVALGIGVVALRSVRHAEPVPIVGVGSSALAPSSDPPAVDAAPAALVPSVAPSSAPPELAPTVTAPASAEPSPAAPAASKGSSRAPQPPGSAPPATPRPRRTEKDPFKRDVF
jgi:serine/threonine protein kinase